MKLKKIALISASALMLASSGIGVVNANSQAQVVEAKAKKKARAGSSKSNPIKLEIYINRTRFNNQVMQTGIQAAMQWHMAIVQNHFPKHIDNIKNLPKKDLVTGRQGLGFHGASWKGGDFVKGAKRTIQFLSVSGLKHNTWYKIKDFEGKTHVFKTTSSITQRIPWNYTFIVGGKAIRPKPINFTAKIKGKKSKRVRVYYAPGYLSKKHVNGQKKYRFNARRQLFGVVYYQMAKSGLWVKKSDLVLK